MAYFAESGATKQQWLQADSSGSVCCLCRGTSQGSKSLRTEAIARETLSNSIVGAQVWSVARLRQIV